MTESDHRHCFGPRFLKGAAVFCGLALLVFASFHPLLKAPRLYDDHVLLEQAEKRAEISGEHLTPFQQALREPRPVRFLSHALDAHLFGDDAVLPHAENLLLHTLMAFLGGCLLLRLGAQREEAWLGAALFAVLPVVTDSLGILSHRKELLAGVFLMGALLLAIPETESRHGRTRLFLAVAVLFPLAVFSKETALVLPVLYLACAAGRFVFHKGEIGRAKGRRWTIGATCLMVAGGVLAVMAYHQIQSSVAAYQELLSDKDEHAGRLLAGASWNEAFGTAFRMFPRYLLLMVSPLRHCLDEDVGTGSGTIAAALFALAIVVITVLGLKKCWRISFPLCWILSGLSVALNPAVLRTGQVAIVADRYAYVAAFGMAFLVAMAVVSLLHRRHWALWSTAIVLLAVYGACSFRYARTFQTEEGLWRECLRVNPQSYQAAHNLAQEIAKQKGRDDEAIVEFRRMLKLKPDFEFGIVSYASFLRESKGVDEALRLLKELPTPVENLPKVLGERGALYLAKGQVFEAIADYELALKKGQDGPQLRHNYAMALQRVIRWHDAEASFRISGQSHTTGTDNDLRYAQALSRTPWIRPLTAGEKDEYVVVGDSVPFGYNDRDPGQSRSLAKRLDGRVPDATFTDFSEPGSMLRALPSTLRKAIAPKSVRHCILLSGHNDALGGLPPSALLQTAADCAFICRMNGVEPIFISPIPVQSSPKMNRKAQRMVLDAYCQMLQGFCNEHAIRYIDLRASFCSSNDSDSLIDSFSGVHLTDKGMDVLADIVSHTFVSNNGYQHR